MNQDDEEALLTRMRRGHPDSLICSPESDLVIEGYPRSGNTFIHDMISVLTEGGKRLRIAHHTHAVENLELASLYGVPACVLIRRPEDAILSYHIYSGYPIEECARRYEAFYSSAVDLSGPVVVAGFDRIVGDFGAVVEKLNSILERPIPVAVDLDEAAARALARAGQRARRTHGADALRKGGVPSAERDRVKAGLRDQVQDHLRRAPEIDRLFQRVVETGR